MTQRRWMYLRFSLLALLFVWVVFYQAGPARVQFQAAWANNHSSVDQVIDPIFDLAVPIFAIGFGVAVLKPRDVKAWLLLGLLLSFAEALRTGPPITAPSPWLGFTATAYQSAGEHLWPAWFLLFLVYFPSRPQTDLRWPWLKWLILAPFTIEALMNVARDLGYSPAPPPFGAVIAYVLMSCAFILLSARYFMAQSADERRRLRLFYWGTLVTLLPAIALTAAKNILHKHDLAFLPIWVVFIILGLFSLFPATLAYVIVVQRAMDVRVVVRQGLRYALAKNGVAVLRALGIAVVIIMAVRLSQYGAGLLTQTLTVAAGIVVITGVGWLADGVRKWIDRRFFREQLRAEEVLAALAADVHRIARADELVEMVAQKVASSLHVDRVAVWIMNGHGPAPAYAINADGWDIKPALQRLQENKRAAILYASGSVMGSGAEVALPLTARDLLLGAIVLGTKRSEEPYSRMELDVLESVASHTGLALDNSMLVSSLAQEAINRERLNREVEIAREVQQRLLPQAGPSVAGLEYAGVCRPALGVGGDYYDFLQLDDGRFGFAIGDVSGKGFAAALLMASLQASLRGQTLNCPDDLPLVMARVNRLLFEATPSNRYATFFYSQYEPASRKLTWVNAGHNPPLLFRGKEIRRLDEGGPVVGLFRQAHYTQGSTELQAGDLLVAFTDGISEAMDANDEEWGEDQLCASVANISRGLPITELVAHCLECADAHAAGAPQHDDMTLVAIRAVPFG